MISDNEIVRILSESNSIAVVGCSRNPEKDAYKVPKYLKEQGYKIIPINPSADEILGERVYKTISEIEEPVDVINIFRPSEECLQVVKEAIKLKPMAIWMQLGIRNVDAAKLAEKYGIKVVMDKCMMVEHKRLIAQAL